MSSLLPLRSTVNPSTGEPRVLRVDEEAADSVFSALGSETARTIYAELHDEPRTASEIADAADTSLQNARYHLEKLLEAELVEIVDTWYSERGTEMKVYAPASNSVVVFAGDEGERSRLRTALGQILGVLAVLGVLGAAIHLAVAPWLIGGGGNAGPTAAADAEGTTYTEPAGELDAVNSALAVVPPGLWFVIGGLTAIAVLIGVVYLQDRLRGMGTANPDR